MADFELFDNLTPFGTTSSPYPQLTTADVLAMMQAFEVEVEASRKRELRGWSDACERVICPRCQRRPTLTRVWNRDVLNICQTVLDRIQRQSGIGHGFMLGGIWLEAFPCDPKPRL